jgi:hypothetical protein
VGVDLQDNEGTADFVSKHNTCDLLSTWFTPSSWFSSQSLFKRYRADIINEKMFLKEVSESCRGHSISVGANHYKRENFDRQHFRVIKKIANEFDPEGGRRILEKHRIIQKKVFGKICNICNNNEDMQYLENNNFQTYNFQICT